MVVLGLLMLVPLSRIHGGLDGAKAAMIEGRDALVSGHIAEAGERFAGAGSAIAEARRALGDPLVRAAGRVPILRRSVDATGAIADAATLVARAGQVVTEALGGFAGNPLPAGRSATIPAHGFSELTPSLAEAHRLLERAAEALDDAPSSWLVGPVGDARELLGREIHDAREAVGAADGLARALPSFLGVDRTRRYFVGAQNPAELRGTGGVIGAYAIMTAREGRLRLGPFTPIQHLPDLDPSRSPRPQPSYAARYARFGAPGLWLNINMSPDFPTVASAIERLYRRSEGARLDGTILTDPFALARLLEVTGPTQEPASRTRVAARTAVPFLTNEAFALFPDPDRRKRVLGDVAAAVLRTFLEQEGTSVRGMHVLGTAAADGHLLLHARDPNVQAAFERAGISGALPRPPGDLLGVVANNAAGNKTDFYARRSVTYRVHLEGRGVGRAWAAISLANDAPTTGQPPYVIGPYPGVSDAGENISHLGVYCGPVCRLEAFRRDGVSEPAGPQLELGNVVVPTTVTLPSGGSQTLEYEWRSRPVWEGDEREGTYTLVFDGQTTVRPTQLDLEIRVPEGMRITRTSPAMQVDGNRAEWAGHPGDDMTFEVWFERPFLSRAWDSATRFLSRPLLTLGD